MSGAEHAPADEGPVYADPKLQEAVEADARLTSELSDIEQTLDRATRRETRLWTCAAFIAGYLLLLMVVHKYVRPYVEAQIRFRNGNGWW